MDYLSLWPFGLFVLALTVLYRFIPRERQTVIFFATATGVLFTYAQVREANIQNKGLVYQNRESVRHNQLSVSFDYMKREGQIPFSVASDGLEKVRGKTPLEIWTVFKDDKVRQPLVDVFNYFEDMSLAARLGYADEEALCAYFEEPAVRYFGTLKPWVDDYRARPGKTGSYEQYEWIYNRWRRGCPTRPK